eukprot:CAMPEP_0201589022 /NCGR_PEP_ID=MMETSP0190_2-20130828/161947_1 /ASSEMBLY_ACC=CAM_ASM_000263 /TAXON_ID=37353 /ORGANISM="Rosalina sp." /LENGTH=96 /DNA_ID=CAMNT_0048042361 /DNA_START=80 /DNA_END=370 /DNA_ORIENTATION=+
MEKAFPSQKDFNDYLIKTIGSKETGEYEIYQDFTKVIEGKLKDIDEAEYPLIVEKFLNELKQNISSLNANDEDSLQNNDENDIEQSNQINENDNDS